MSRPYRGICDIHIYIATRTCVHTYVLCMYNNYSHVHAIISICYDAN